LTTIKVLLKISKFLFISLLSNLLFSFPDDIETSLWVERHHLYKKSSIDSLIFEAFDNNIENIYLQVRSRGDALYRSDIVSFNSNIESGFDPLEYSLMLADLLNIKVHAWINTYLIWSAELPPDDDHLYYQNPEWIDKPSKTLDSYLSKNIVYLSPNHPDVNIYIEKIVKELIDNYPEIDGVHFDYIRNQNNNYGFNEMGIEVFENIYRFNPLNITSNHRELGLTNFEKDSLTNIWNAYNQNNITKLLREIRLYVNSFYPEILLSAAVKPNPNEAKNRWSQDWISWINNNILDFVIPMNYGLDNHLFIDNLRRINKEILNIDKVVMGIAIYNQDEAAVAKKIILSKYSGFNKICLFSYNSLRKNNIDFNLIRYEYLNNKFIIED